MWVLFSFFENSPLEFPVVVEPTTVPLTVGKFPFPFHSTVSVVLGHLDRPFSLCEVSGPSQVSLAIPLCGAFPILPTLLHTLLVHTGVWTIPHPHFLDTCHWHTFFIPGTLVKSMVKNLEKHLETPVKKPAGGVSLFLLPTAGLQKAAAPGRKTHIGAGSWGGCLCPQSTLRTPFYPTGHGCLDAFFSEQSRASSPLPMSQRPTLRPLYLELREPPPVLILWNHIPVIFLGRKIESSLLIFFSPFLCILYLFSP